MHPQAPRTHSSGRSMTTEMRSPSSNHQLPHSLGELPRRCSGSGSAACWLDEQKVLCDKIQQRNG